MKFTVETEHYDEEAEDYVKEEKTLVMPEQLKADVGDEADRKLNAKITLNNKPNNNRDGNSQQASVKITQGQFSETVDYIVRSMVNQYNRGDEVDIDKLTNSSKKKIGRHYFNQLEVLDSKKKAEDES